MGSGALSRLLGLCYTRYTPKQILPTFWKLAACGKVSFEHNRPQCLWAQHFPKRQIQTDEVLSIGLLVISVGPERARGALRYYSVPAACAGRGDCDAGYIGPAG